MTNKNQTHTPTPWKVSEPFKSRGWNYVEIRSAEGHTIARIILGRDDHMDKAALERAAFIVRAVNAHDDLVTALKDLVSIVKGNPGRTGAQLAKVGEIKAAEAAIAKAEGSSEEAEAEAFLADEIEGKV